MRAASVLFLSFVVFSCRTPPAAGSGPTDSPCPAVPANLPASIAAPPDVHPALELHASGVQIYACKANDAGAYAWSLVGPDAQLFPACGPTGAAVAHHFAGPTWKWLADGSEFVASGAAATKAPSPVEPGANIPWVLLPKASGSAAGYLSAFSFVQRVETRGGVAPANGCSASNLGAESRVPYEANYLFYGR